MMFSGRTEKLYVLAIGRFCELNLDKTIYITVTIIKGSRSEMFEAEEGFITQRRKTQSIANKGVRVETGTEETETGADNKEKTTKKQKKRKQQKKDTK